MFKVRLLSSIVLMILMLFFVITGGNVLLVATAFLSIMAMMEFMRMAKIHKTPLAVPGYAVVVLLYVLLFTGHTEWMVPLAVFFLLAVMAVYVVAFPKFRVEQLLYLFFGFFYAGLLISYIYQVRMLEGGTFSVWLIFIAAWGSDVFAYCAGKLFGKHKAFPVLSPKKTWEGCIGGVLGAAVVAVLYGLAMNQWFAQNFSPVQFAFVCGCGAVISQIGDLAASAMKRNNDIKDYGRLIPGHGGVLDRFDSVIFVAPIVFYLLQMTI
ncbi:MAG: phosphatidate cytidylyltransferase [Lachnospiraceae bacterium]|nr:phosphatidate cytidylyltransferase [Lachnospiraceae bacterium]